MCRHYSNLLSVIFPLASSITKLKAIVEARKGKPDSKKTRNTRKRRRPINQDDDSSSDESEIPKPKFTVNDENPFISQRRSSTDPKDVSKPQLRYGVPLDLSSPTTTTAPSEKNEIKIKTEVEVEVEDEKQGSSNNISEADDSTTTCVKNSSPLVQPTPSAAFRSGKLEDIIVNLKREHELNELRNKELNDLG